MAEKSLFDVIHNRVVLEAKKWGSRRGRTIFTKKNNEESKKRRKMAKTSRKINRRK